MLDHSGTYAAIIYAPAYLDDDLPDVPAAAANADDLASVLSDRDLVGIPPENVHLIHAVNPVTVAERLLDVAEKARHVLLVYYVGHGLLGPDNRLYLTTAVTSRHRVEYNGLDYELVRKAIKATSARTRVIIVDCCFSGRAIGALTDEAGVLAGQLDVEGTYIMTSTGPNDPASAPPGARNTAFTGELLGVLRHGIPGAGAQITLKQVFDQVERNLRAKGLPRPDRDVYRHADNMMLVRNAAPRNVAEEPESPEAPEGNDQPAGPVRSWPRGRRARLAAALVTAVALAVVTVVVVLSWVKAPEPFAGRLDDAGEGWDVAFSPDGKLIATGGGNDHTVMLWDAATGERVRVLVSCCLVSHVSFSSDNKLVATDAELFDVATGSVVHHFTEGGGAAAFSSDGRFVATGSDIDQGGLRLFELPSGELAHTFSTGYTSSIAFSPVDDVFASATGDYPDLSVQLWDPAGRRKIRTIVEGTTVLFSPDGETLATRSRGKVQLWDPDTGAHRRDIDAGDVLAFGHDGKLFVIDANTQVRLYDATTGAKLCDLANTYAKTAALSPDDQRLVTVGPTNAVDVVDVADRCG